MSDFFQTSDLEKTTESTEDWRNAANQLVTAGHSTPRDQWLRKISLVTYDGSSQKGIDLSQLRITFTVKKATNITPNLLTARVYNLSPQTMAKVIEFKRIQLQAGYQQGSFGVIFDGTVVQYVRGKENAVDTYLDIIGGDGDRALNNAVLIKTLPAGSTDRQRLDAALATLKEYEVTSGHIAEGFDKGKSLRGITDAVDARSVLRELMNKYGADFYIDNGVANVVGRDSYLPGEAVVLAPNTGLVGMPQVTPQGIEATCLLNSKLRLGGLVKIDSSILSGVPYQPGTASKTDAQGNVALGQPTGGPRFPTETFGAQLNAAFTSPVGLYKILLIEFTGDTRGNPWYANLICVAIGKNGKIILSGNPADALKRAHPQATAGGF